MEKNLKKREDFSIENPELGLWLLMRLAVQVVQGPQARPLLRPQIRLLIYLVSPETEILTVQRLLSMKIVAMLIIITDLRKILASKGH